MRFLRYEIKGPYTRIDVILELTQFVEELPRRLYPEGCTSPYWVSQTSNGSRWSS